MKNKKNKIKFETIFSTPISKWTFLDYASLVIGTILLLKALSYFL